MCMNSNDLEVLYQFRSVAHRNWTQIGYIIYIKKTRTEMSSILNNFFKLPNSLEITFKNDTGDELFHR